MCSGFERIIPASPALASMMRTRTLFFVSEERSLASTDDILAVTGAALKREMPEPDARDIAGSCLIRDDDGKHSPSWDS